MEVARRFQTLAHMLRHILTEEPAHPTSGTFVQGTAGPASHAQPQSVLNVALKDLHSTQSLKWPDNNVYSSVYKRHEFWRTQAVFV